MISWEWDFLEVSFIQNEDMISWEWNFLEVSSIREGGGREYVVNVSVSTLGKERVVFVSHFAHQNDPTYGLTFLSQSMNKM